MKLEWKKDAFGNPDQALMIGNAHIGSVGRYVRDVEKVRPWRGWFMNDCDGVCTGWYETEAEAKESVEAAFKPGAIL